MSERLSASESWMAVADAVGRRSRCSRSQIGAVIINPDGRVVSTGYNGPPAEHEPSQFGLCVDWCARGRADKQNPSGYTDCPAIHAEANALLHAPREDVIDGTMYTTRVPCFECAKLIANSGITTVLYLTHDTEPDHIDTRVALKLLADSGVTAEAYYA